MAANVIDPTYIEERKKRNVITAQKKEQTGKRLKEKETVNRKTGEPVRKESKQKSKTKELKPKIQRKETKRRLIYSSSSSDDDDIEMVLSSGGEREEDFNQNQCAECCEMCSEILSASDWIKCNSCFRWLHESCSIYADKCALCGRRENKKKAELTKK